MKNALAGPNDLNGPNGPNGTDGPGCPNDCLNLIGLATRSMGIALFVFANVANAEIVFLENGQVASSDALYAYQHPSLRSVVFLSPETRQAAILPPSSVVIASPPLLYRSAAGAPLFPPSAVLYNMYTAPRLNNRDSNNQNLQRAHAFSQGGFEKDNYRYNPYFSTVDIGGGVSLIGYGYGAYGSSAYGPGYPPPMAPGFNQPARPSNQSMNAYHLDRAHRFSMDGYK